MNFKYFMLNGIIGLILVFLIQSLQFIRVLAIKSGFMDGSPDYNLLTTHLVIVPIVFFIISLIFLLLWLYKDLEINKG
ncbi:hypothetical protein ACP0AK_10320 [Listeria ivanovii]|uniref:Uncharacterized protein n=1 Tax=Listeria ivanovii (strain ATCC BAA-678 / PAM 55) TaxID=881621 RepID=G2Z989_LISIP|nr:hypothetical protein [Listeria ivanovii]AHI57175.1 glycosyltransferase [Listeria ivanovii WSLC3009]AIS66595.1 glycosyltransferase [Listeria ivanovii subsp. ivanovii]MCJ1717897.1 hypothetical protein [Listeria ivanovii]MCJ1723095.1 hypothetical protein [Listeria ivanovii]MCJ1735662.1 hypothetical protein [Listeria ivanovii]